MFDWKLFFILISICIPGIIFMIPATKLIYQSIQTKIPADKKILSNNFFLLISSVQSLLLVTIASAIGTALHYKVNLYAPLFEAISNNQNLWAALQPQILPSFIFGISGAGIFLLAYYFIFRPRLDEQTIRSMENLRTSVGVFGRVFYGGIVEEVLCRWGLMTLFVWLGLLLIKEPSPLIYWAAILFSGLIFALGHLPGYLAFGCKKSANFIAMIIGLNLWASIIFGWLFWHYGLCSAMIAHALFHIVWYPFDLLTK